MKQFVDKLCDACSTRPCSNNASCKNNVDILPGFQCFCLPGFTGLQCETSTIFLNNVQYVLPAFK